MNAALRFREPVRRAAAAALVLLLAGCTTPPAAERIHGHGAISLPLDVRTVGLATARALPSFGMVQPLTQRDAMRSLATETASITAADPRAAILFPAGYVVGGLVGMTMGADAAEIAQAVRTIEAALRDAQLDARLATLCAEQLARQPGVTLLRLPGAVPVDPPSPPSRVQRPAHPWHDRGVDLAVGWWLSSLQFRFLSAQAVSPFAEANASVALEIGFEISTVRPRDWSSAGGVTFLYQSEPHSLLRWAADDAALFRREIERFIATLERELSERIRPAG